MGYMTKENYIKWINQCNHWIEYLSTYMLEDYHIGFIGKYHRLCLRDDSGRVVAYGVRQIDQFLYLKVVNLRGRR